MRSLIEPAEPPSAQAASTAVLVTMKDNEGNIGWAIEPSGEATEEPSEEPTETSEPEAQ